MGRSAKQRGSMHTHAQLVAQLSGHRRLPGAFEANTRLQRENRARKRSGRFKKQERLADERTREDVFPWPTKWEKAPPHRQNRRAKTQRLDSRRSKPCREGIGAAKCPNWKPLKHSPWCQSLQPAAAVPWRGGFEGGQTSGVKAVKTQPSVPKPARTVKSQVAAKRPDWKPVKNSPLCQSLQPAAAVPWRGGFEGGQTSGVKAVKTQPSVPKPARTVKSQVLRPLAEPVATVPRREAFEGGQTSGLKAGKKQPIVPKPAASGSRTLPGRVWGRPNVRSDRRWNTAHCARACRKRWKAKFWGP